MPSRSMGVTSGRSQVQSEHSNDRMSMRIGDARYSAEPDVVMAGQPWIVMQAGHAPGAHTLPTRKLPTTLAGHEHAHLPAQLAYGGAA